MKPAALLLVPFAALVAFVVRKLRRPPPPPMRRRAASASSTGIYQTAPDDLAPPVWVRLGSVELAELVARDGGGAILSYAQGLAAARTNGAELVTRDDLIALSDAARAAGANLVRPAELELPDAEQRAAGARPGDPAMRSRAWRDREDSKIQAAKSAGRWDPGALKYWVAGAARGRARLMGLRQPSGTWEQSGLDDPHDQNWSDYMTRTMLRRPLRVA